MRAIAIALVLAACSGGGKKGLQTSGGDTNAGLAGWEVMRSVFQHPRCQNCHPADDTPLQGDLGAPHNQEVQRGADGFGMAGARCTTCHGPANKPPSYGEHQPPGNIKGWHMPPPEMKMVFVGMSSNALCEQTKDPARNGGKDMKALREHMDDPLVLWGWDPGVGRQPVPVPHPEFVRAFEAWAAAGAPCPAP